MENLVFGDLVVESDEEKEQWGVGGQLYVALSRDLVEGKSQLGASCLMSSTPRGVLANLWGSAGIVHHHLYAKARNFVLFWTYYGLRGLLPLNLSASNALTQNCVQCSVLCTQII